MQKLLYTCLLTLLTFTLSAQDHPPHKVDYTISSKAFGDERKITIYLPPSFYKYPEDKFIVTYVLDGHFDPFIDLVVKTLEYNSYMYKYIPTIVVGIHAKQRGQEFSAPSPQGQNKNGKAPLLQQHFKNEVFPLVDSIYNARVLPFKSLIGHSSGGTFVLYNLFSEEHDLFDAYLAISPAIRQNNAYILEKAAADLKQGKQFPKFLYCASGTVGEREELFGGAIRRLDSTLQVYPNHKLLWRTSTFEGMGHWTCVPPALNAGMVILTRAFRVDEKMYFDFANNKDATMTAQIEAFYKNRKATYGFIEIPIAGYLNQIGKALINKEKRQAALEVYDWSLKQHPAHYRLTRSRAELLLEMGNEQAAYTAFQDSLKLLEGMQASMSAEDYEAHKEYLQEKLAAANNKN